MYRYEPEWSINLAVTEHDSARKDPDEWQFHTTTNKHMLDGAFVRIQSWRPQLFPRVLRVPDGK